MSETVQLEPRSRPNQLHCWLVEYSIPLILGVIIALALANVAPETYHHVIHWRLFGGPTLHFWMNDVFMVFFFGIAAKEITESCLPGGALNPITKAINPLLGTLGGVLGPIVVYIGLVYAFGQGKTYGNGWGIPTATDIALAWLVARVVFGSSHPAVNFLLLLAVADDAIGMGIIAVFYPDAAHPVQPVWLLLTAFAMALAYGMRRIGVKAWQPYVLGAGGLSWMGLYSSHLHPALALVAVVPFLPHGRRDPGLFVEGDEREYLAKQGHNPLHDYEHETKTAVDYGLFLFAFCNAGVEFSSIGPATWYVFAALLVGKTAGITGFSLAGTKLGFPLPNGMKLPHLALAGLVAGMGLTVALFVAGEALTGVPQAEAKMGALFSGFAGIAAIALGMKLGLRREIPDEVFDTWEADAETETEPESIDVPEGSAQPDAVTKPNDVVLN